MKPLIVSAHDLHGGAARAAYRLHKSLRSIGVDSTMLVQHRLSEDPHVIGHAGLTGRIIGGVRVKLDRLPLVRYPDRSELWFSPSWLPGREIVRAINRSDADLVHLHWIAAGMMRIEHVAQIEKPVVWTLHDMWPITGGCHYDDGCGRFADSCGVCPQLGNQSHRDLSSWIHMRKKETFAKRSQLDLVASSRWMARHLESSPIMAGRSITVLPNPVETDVYRPIDRAEARKSLGLPLGAKLILFGAVRADDPIKGFGILRQALGRFAGLPDYRAVLFGASDAVGVDLPIPFHDMGSISNESELRDIYSAADAFVVPSIQDNLPLVATESLACGTPVVAFDVTGLPDIVDHKVTGYLASPFLPDDLAAGITWALSQPRDEIRRSTREAAVSRYEAGLVARSYVDLYTTVLATGVS